MQSPADSMAARPVPGPARAPGRVRAQHLPAALLMGALAACATPPDAPAPARPGFAAALERALPVTVSVHGMGRCTPLLGDEDDEEADVPPGDATEGDDDAGQIGAGFLLDGEGHLATAAHVVQGCPRVVVGMADRRVQAATIVGVDSELDIAVLRVATVPAARPAWGVSAALRPGDWVLAVGQPFALNRSVSAGVVAGKDRHFVEEAAGLYIQTDLNMSPGNSGGPLLDAQGRIVGMNVRSVVGSAGTAAVSLAIPIELVLQAAAPLRQGRPPMRARLGADFEDVLPPSALAAGRAYADGAHVTRVRMGSPAQRMGLHPGDIVVGWNGRAIVSAGDLARTLATWTGDAGTRVTVFRGGGFRELQLP